MNKKATTGRIILLVIVFILIWFLLVNKFETETIKIEQAIQKEELKDEQNYGSTTIVVIKDENKTISTSSSSQPIITNRYTMPLQNDGTLIIKSDGKYYEVKEGSFILDKKVVKVSEDSKSVEFLETPRRTLSSN